VNTTTRVASVLAGDRITAIKAAFLLAGLLSFLFSVYLWFFVDRQQGLFVGIWVPSMWSLGALLLSTPERLR
jgi:ABC-type multidrug transport system permease subunit